MKELDLLDDFASDCESLYVYGAGMVGQRVIQYLKSSPYGSLIKGIIVSNRVNELNNISGIRVFQPNEVDFEDMRGIIVGMQTVPFQVKENCFNLQSERILCLNIQLQKALRKWQLERLCCIAVDGGCHLKAPSETDDPEAVICFSDDSKYFRVYNLECEDHIKSIKEYCTMAEFEKEYGGRLKRLGEKDWKDSKDNHNLTEVFIATTHLDDANVFEDNNGVHYFLQVGAALTKKRKGCKCDNVGINISRKNRSYCECTGIYWIWKNTSGQDYVGLEHYRRRMVLGKADVESLSCNNVDIVLPLPQFSVLKNMEHIHKSLVTSLDWELMKRFVTDFCPAYKDIIAKYENGYFYFSCNIGLLRREIFDDYCSFAFSVADKLETYYAEHSIIRLEDRYMGFIFEHMFSIYIMKHYKDWNVYVTDLLWKT